MSIVRGQKSIGLTSGVTQESTLPLPDAAPSLDEEIQRLIQRFSNLETLVERKADNNTLRSAIRISPEAILLEARDVGVIGTFTVADIINEQNGTTNGAVPISITQIRGDVIKTGTILSNNWGASAGSAYNLNDGTITIGGSSAPNLRFDGTNLTVKGSITAGSVIANTVTITGTNNSLETIDGRATNGQVTYEGLRTGGTTILTGVIVPTDSGALKTGTITWDATTGALTGGTGVAITEWGIIGAGSGVAKFTINAATGDANFAGTITAGAVIANSVTITGSGNSLEIIDGRATNGQVTYEGLRTGGTTILTGVIRPENTGAVAVGSITWNTTTGALTGGSGIAITEWGIIGASGGSATFSINASTGAAIFAGDISGASGSFSGSLITGGQVLSTGQTTISGQPPASIIGNIGTIPAGGGSGVLGRAVGNSGSSADAIGVSGVAVSAGGLGSVFGVFGYADGSNGVGVYADAPTGIGLVTTGSLALSALGQSNFGAFASGDKAINITSGYISKSRVTGHVLEVWLGGISQGVFEYEFRKI